MSKVRDTDEAVQRYLEEYGVTWLPYRAPRFHKKDCDRNRPSPISTFSPAAEVAKLEAARAKRDKARDEYRRKKFNSEIPQELTFRQYYQQYYQED